MAYVNVARFTAVSASSARFVVSAAVTGYQTPASAGAVDAATYSYRAENASLTEWEIGTGTYISTSAALTRTPSASTNGGAVVVFTTAPQVAITALAADLASAASLTAGTLPAARLPFPDYTTIGGVLASSAITNQFLTRISSLGVPTAAQPAFSNLSSGISVTQMATGAGASATTFWRGDGTWNTPAGTGLTAATSAEVETATSNTVGITPGRAVFSPYVAKAWVKWGVTTTINVSVGVSSITDNAAGNWSINFSTTFSSTNYAVSAICLTDFFTNNYASGIAAQSTASLNVGVAQMGAYTGSGVDPTSNYAIAFGDQ